MHPALLHVDHRPWPLPPGRWTWRQSWCDLLFAHWPIDAASVRSLVPPELEIDSFEGRTFAGVVPFRMRGVMRRPLPDLPWISAFPELNLRLYVRLDERPGVWFLSLDATNPLAVHAARRFFHLPYYHARISCEERGRRIHYASLRKRDPRGLAFECEYGSTSPAYRAQPGTLEHWLTERYCLYAKSSPGALVRCEVHHVPWPLERAEACIRRNELGAPFGLAISGEPELLHFARRLDVVVWPPEIVRARSVEPRAAAGFDEATRQLPWGKLRNAYGVAIDGAVGHDDRTLDRASPDRFGRCGDRG